MRISHIVAVDRNRAIGLDNRLPWKLSSDLKRFKSLTMGHCLIMGRKTFYSIGKPLPGRTSIILTKSPEFSIPGCLIAHNLSDAVALAQSRSETEAFIIGGAQVFAASLSITDRIYLTSVHTIINRADVYYPELNREEWQVISSTLFLPGLGDEYMHTFEVLDRIIQANPQTTAF